jgi:CRISPR-associated protein Cmr4
MYRKAYGIIETLAPLHVGATAGEESGNLNLIFRDQFTQTGIVPGSSIRGRLRSEMRQGDHDENYWYGKAAENKSKKAAENDAESEKDNQQSESIVKFEYASLLWLPVFCPGQPIVWVTSPKLLKRYQRIVGAHNLTLKAAKLPEVYTRSATLTPLNINKEEKLFFNFGFLTLKGISDLSVWFPLGEELPAIVVADDEIGMIHDMALYRQSRVRLKDDEKRVDGGGFFNTEALPEGTQMVFPIAIRPTEKDTWQPFGDGVDSQDIYLGGLESIGFGNCQITLKGDLS